MSSTALTKEKLAELVKCVLCMKTFTSPQTMKCLHTFCRHCIQNHAKRSSIDDVKGLECPRCKHFTAQTDITSCTRTERLLELSHRCAKRKMCFECENESAEWKCQDCGDCYCETCKQMHLKIKKLKDHKFFDVQATQDILTLNRTVYCTKHSIEEIKGYCFDCDVLLCSLCLLQGHDGHKRDTVHNALDHVKSKVDEKLAAVEQITNERFLRANKLKDTRLVIQTYADQSSDAIRSRYQFLKHKLDDDYQSLMHELKTSVDAELEKVNAAIVAEEAKQSHATAVTSYVENTLATNSEAMLIQESIQQLVPTIERFCDVERDLEPPVTSHFYRLKITEYLDDWKTNMIGEIETMEVSIHSRYQPVITKEQLESASVGRTIDINLDTEVKGYRIDVGYGKILVCFWSISTILIYNSDGTKFKRLDLSGELDQLISAVFVDASHMMVATVRGLALVDLTTSSVLSMIGNTQYSAICHFNDTVFAMNVKKKTLDSIKKNGKDWIVDSVEPISLTSPAKIHTSSTTVCLPNCVIFCNYGNEVCQFSLSGELLQTVTVNDRQTGSRDRFICAVDVDSRMLLSVGGQLVLQHNDQSQVVKLDGVTNLKDIVFEDQYTFWVLEHISVKQKTLVKYTI